MEEDIQNYSPTVMFRGTPCMSKLQCLVPHSHVYLNSLLHMYELQKSAYHYGLCWHWENVFLGLFWYLGKYIFGKLYFETCFKKVINVHLRISLYKVYKVQSMRNVHELNIWDNCITWSWWSIRDRSRIIQPPAGVQPNILYIYLDR